MIHAYATRGPKHPLEPFDYDPGPLGPEEVEVAVEHCGLCHSDLSVVNNEWGNSVYPAVLGHEAIGKVVALGAGAKGLKVGQRVGVGWTASTCGHCHPCLSGDQHLCTVANVPTILGHHGGFADRVRAQWPWVVPLPDGVDPREAGPLLCGGRDRVLAAENLRRAADRARRRRRHRRARAPRAQVRPRLGLRGLGLHLEPGQDRRGEGLRRA